jgi:hypothetical protein
VENKCASVAFPLISGGIYGYLKDEALRVANAAPMFLEKAMMAPSVAVVPQRLDDLVGNLDEPFTATLFRLIDATGKTDAEIYKRANIDRRLFSKIRSNKHYAPSF